MLEFATREIQFFASTMEAACLVSKPGNVDESDVGIIKDDLLIELPGELIVGIAETAARCESMEKSGFGVDCGVFGALVLGGTYNPVPEVTYGRALHRRIEFGRSWSRLEVLGATATAEMAQFCAWYDRPLPRHVAIKLPSTEGQYIQKVGHGLPIAICDAMANFRFHGANTVVSTNSFTATHDGQAVLSYESNRPDQQSAGVYIGLPG